MDLLGKRKLEEEIVGLRSRIDDLEQELADLRRTLVKREEKIKKLTRDHQESSRLLKAAEQKISNLVKTEPVETLSGERIESSTLSPAEVKRLADRLSSIRLPQADLVSAYLVKATPTSPGDNQLSFGEIRSDRGLIAFLCPDLFDLCLVPPFPLVAAKETTGEVFDLGPLRAILDTPVLVISAHAGETLLGVALGSDELVEHDVVRSAVKEKHTKGGWSQKRFERLREEDVRQHADLVAERLRPFIDGYGSDLAYAVVSGDPIIVRQIEPHLGLPLLVRKMARFDRKRVDRVLDEVYGFVCYRG